MRYRHLRNATGIVELESRRWLIDPMLADVGALPGFKLFGGGRRPNPLVPLPAGTSAWLDEVTDVVVTHEHPDHFDVAGRAWVRERKLPVWASPTDVPSLRRRGLDARPIADLGVPVEVVPAKHGRGALGWLMGPVSGFFFAPPGAPSLLLTSDATWTDALEAAIARLRPDVIVAPAGSANMGLGGDILFSVDELVRLVRAAPGEVILNHLEALDHCPTRRGALAERLAREGLADRVWIPEDGEDRVFRGDGAPVSDLRSGAPAPDFRKWLTAKLA
ncbi:MAG: MBL fold metallo-hydrolase [Polyangiales bacterium]